METLQAVAGTVLALVGVGGVFAGLVLFLDSRKGKAQLRGLADTQGWDEERKQAEAANVKRLRSRKHRSLARRSR